MTTAVVILAALVGFLAAMFRNNAKVAKETETEATLLSTIAKDSTTTQADQAKADKEVAEYEKILSDLDPDFHNTGDGNTH